MANMNVGGLRGQTLDQIRAANPGLADQLTYLVKTPVAGTHVIPLSPGLPIDRHPLVARALVQQHVADVTQLAKLAGPAAAHISALGTTTSLDNMAIASLVKANTLTADQGKSLGFAVALQTLADFDLPFATALRDLPLPRLGRPATSTRELATLGPSDWASLFANHQVALPAGTTAAAAGKALAGRLAVLHPNAAFFGRMPVFDRSAPPPTQAALINSFPGLGLEQLVASRDVEGVTRRLALFTSVGTTLGDRFVLQLDLSVDSADLQLLGLASAPAADREAVVACLRAHQRVNTLSASIDDAHSIVAAGYSSAFSIANTSSATFGSRVALEASSAKAVWQQARATMAHTSLAASSIVQAIDAGMARRPIAQIPPIAKSYLKQMPGFQDLFGSLSYCSCDECESIYGAAAYFVDLMAFVDENLRPTFNGHPNHQLDLKTRRPDLWTLALTCENTNDRIATLDIVCEVLESFIATQTSYAGSYEDRVALARFVYFNQLLGTTRSFAQPFDLPLARITSYLAELGGDRAQIATAIGADTPSVARCKLGLSGAEWSLISTPKTQLADLATVYDINVQSASLEVPVVAAAMQLGREDLGDLVACAFVKGTSTSLAIVAAKRGPDSIQNDVEWLQGFDAGVLDRMHRFTRLRKHLPWSVAELDRVLGAAGGTLDEPTLVTLGRLRVIQDSTGVAVDDLIALFADMPATLCDARFNPATFLVADKAWPDPGRHFVDPALRTQTSAPSDSALARLLVGLSTDHDGLTTLIHHLATPLGVNLAAPADDDRFVTLSASNLALLYRHSLVAKKLGVSIDDLFQLLGFVGLTDATGIGAVERLLDLRAWTRANTYQMNDIAVALGMPPADPSIELVPADVAASVVASAVPQITFKDTLFAVEPGLTEQASRDVLTQNTAIVEPADPTDPTVWRLRADIAFDTATITVPASAVVPDATSPTGLRTVTADELRAVLSEHVPAQVIVRALGASFGFSPEKIGALLSLTGQAMTADVIRAAESAGPIAPLVSAIAAIAPVATTFRSAAWDASALAFVQATPAAFGMAAGPLSHVTIDQLRALAIWPRLVARATAQNTSIDPADLASILSGYTAGSFAASADAAIARVLEVPLGLVVGLRGRVTFGPTAAAALDQLDRAATTALALGLDGEALAATISTDYDTVEGAANAAQAALRAKNPDESTRADVLDRVERPVREAKRDALAAWLIHCAQPRVWSTQDDLYEYFLIDVAAGGCSTTSRVVSATNSVQLYVYRVLMQLEQDELADTDPNHIDLVLEEEPAEEWQWRQNFRVWQANRKVFLWPENYLEPDLRDDKTPLFQDLESTLLGGDITDQTVLDAYNTYLAGFDEVASLKIAGAYHDDNGETDVLHLFGVANTDPLTYYYRSVTNLSASGRDLSSAPVWTSWQKIPVQITSRRVAPLVYDGKLYVFWNSIKTHPVNQIDKGSSKFSGYSHRFSLFYTTFRADGSWTAPQAVQLPADYWYGPTGGEVTDDLTDEVPRLDPRQRHHHDPIDDYTLSGPNWDGMWPDTSDGNLNLSSRDFIESDVIDLFRRSAKEGGAGAPTQKPSLLCANNAKTLWYGKPLIWTWEAAPIANAVIDEKRLDQLDLDVPGLKPILSVGLYTGQLAQLPDDTELLAVPGSVEHGIIQCNEDVIYLQAVDNAAGHYNALRIGTTLAVELARRLFEDGFEELLAYDYQLALKESPLPFTLTGSGIKDQSSAGSIDFTGPYGVYYRELFFHIPFLIANALNAQGQYAAAQRWYQYIFDPMSSEVIKPPPGLDPADAEHRKLDRVWQYREFRGRDLVSLRTMLGDRAALEAYKQEPFNPFAIARYRLSAFQEAIVMKYVDNLLDWADDLFTQFTMESVNEALMLYVTAQDILGPRPTELGDCGESTTPKTYDAIAPLIAKSSEVLIELETWTLGVQAAQRPQVVTSLDYVPDQAALYGAASRYALAVTAAAPAPIGRLTAAVVNPAVQRPPTPVAAARKGTAQPQRPMPALRWAKLQTASWGAERANAAKASTGGRVFQPARPSPSWAGRYGWSVIRQLSPVFCVPVNSDLLAYWDRVEDRLYKIRHCMNIDGIVEELSLFAPPIDPRMLVAAAAAGLTIEDVLGATSGSLPPYRFVYLIDRAKAAAASLTGFGSALLSALEKKDGEDLNKLRLVQSKNLTAMSRMIRQLDIDAAQAVVDATQKQLDAANQRLEFYDNLYSDGRTAWEIAQSTGTHMASIINGTASGLYAAAATLHLIPEAGSPFAMKYGGVALGGSLNDYAKAALNLADAASNLATSAGLEAGFDRRDQTWDHQRKQAKLDVQSITKTLKAAQIRLDQANRSMTIQDTTLQQIEDLIDRNDTKFTNLGLYTWLARQMQILYRAAYQHALALARLADRAFRYERGDDPTVRLGTSYWDATHAGLLAGEGLLGGLQALERRFIETNYRTLEIDQPFALSQIDPQALVKLREKGTCTFTVPEVMFDLFYPGHYKRRIRAVRVTIPCITGPYVNVGATLTLDRSWVRMNPDTTGDPVEVPASRSVSIATSTAQADAGVFELSFRDERYMPFEGQGAISQWSLSLPSAFRQFDYETINDVIISISYTSEFSGTLRDKVESANSQAVGGILTYFTANPTYRAFSLRQDFSSTFSRLVRSPAGTPVKVEITDAHLPLLFRGRAIQVSKVVALARVAPGLATGGLQLAIDGSPISGFVPNATYADLATATVSGPFGAALRGTHTLEITAAGALAPPSPGDGAADPTALFDLILLVEYTLA